MVDAAPLRLAVPADAPAIAALSRDRIELGLGWRWTAPRVLRCVLDRATNVVVMRGQPAAHGERGEPPLRGFGIMKYHDDEAHLLLLAVDVQAVRCGIGSAMVAWLEASACAAGIVRIQLEARDTNEAARAFYARLGYCEVRRLPAYYEGREACVQLAKDLRAASVAR
jgi:[ribosomal protein S18]-alanine N-acetyltransferase